MWARFPNFFKVLGIPPTWSIIAWYLESVIIFPVFQSSINLSAAFPLQQWLFHKVVFQTEGSLAESKNPNPFPVELICISTHPRQSSPLPSGYNPNIFGFQPGIFLHHFRNGFLHQPLKIPRKPFLTCEPSGKDILFTGQYHKKQNLSTGLKSSPTSHIWSQTRDLLKPPAENSIKNSSVIIEISVGIHCRIQEPIWWGT